MDDIRYTRLRLSHLLLEGFNDGGVVLLEDLELGGDGDLLGLERRNLLHLGRARAVVVLAALAGGG